MIGRRLTHYEILEAAGRGGMGEVYKAFDRRLRRSVAIKILPSDLADDARRRRRLLREARAVALANHPGIVTVFDLETDQGVDFVVMEWVDGRTLAQEIAGRALRWQQALELGAQLAEAMAAAHALGVVHRDLKPSNVMLDQAGRVRLLDFGIARVEPLLDQDTRSRTDDGLTEAGASPGTFAYMSPEQILGEQADRPSDVFSLGVVLYEMLTWRRPFAAENLPTLVHELLFEEPVAPSEAASAVPPEIDGVLARALAKAPRDRPDMATLACELRRLLSWSEAGTKDPSCEARPVARGSRRLLVLAALALPAIVLVAFMMARRTIEPVNEPVIESTNRPTIRSERRFPPVSESLPQSPFDIYSHGLVLLQRYDREGYLEQAIERFERTIELDSEYAPGHSGLARAFWRQFRRHRDPVWLHRARASIERALELAPQLTHARVGLALILIEHSDLDAAREKLEAVHRLDPASPDVLSAQALLASKEGRFGDAAAFYRQALEQGREEGLENSPGRWQLLMFLGIAEANRGDLRAAEAALLESTEQVTDNAFAWLNLGAVYHFQGRYEKAAGALQSSISIRPSGSAYSNLGTAYFFLGQYAEAAAAFESALALRPNDYQLWAHQGDALRQISGRERDANDGYRRALQLLRGSHGEQPATQHLSRRALYLAKLGDAELALEDLARLQPLSSRGAAICWRAAQVYEILGLRDEALETLELAFTKGQPPTEIRHEPELTRLRQDLRFHRMALRFEADASAKDVEHEQAR